MAGGKRRERERERLDCILIVTEVEVIKYEYAVLGGRRVKYIIIVFVLTMIKTAQWERKKNLEGKKQK